MRVFWWGDSLTPNCAGRVKFCSIKCILIFEAGFFTTPVSRVGALSCGGRLRGGLRRPFDVPSPCLPGTSVRPVCAGTTRDPARSVGPVVVDGEKGVLGGWVRPLWFRGRGVQPHRVLRERCGWTVTDPSRVVRGV